MIFTLKPLFILIFLLISVAHAIELQFVRRLPHDPTAYTQGLLYLDGVFYESTGLYGESSLRRVDAQTGQILLRHDLPKDFFGEGLALVGDRLIQLTWRENVAFIHRRTDFAPLGQFSYEGEGWGLAFDGEFLVMSNGSAQLFWRHPDDFSVVRQVTVTDRGRPVNLLNELEVVEGRIWANVYGSDRVAVIESHSGNVRQWLDFSRILSARDRHGNEDVLNGIAFDAEQRRVFITGKRYAFIYEFRLKSRAN